MVNGYWFVAGHVERVRWYSSIEPLLLQIIDNAAG